MLELVFALAMFFGFIDGLIRLFNTANKKYTESKNLFDCIFR